MALWAGKLRHRVQIIVRSEAVDEYGAPAPVVTVEATVWASVEPLRGREYFDAAQHQLEVTHRIRMRYRDLDPKDRLIRFDGRDFRVEAVINHEERGESLELLCVEAV